MFRSSLVPLFAGTLVLSACAAAEVTPVRISQPGDQDLNCQALKQQITDNFAAEQKLMQRDHDVMQANTAKGVGGAVPIVGPLIAASTDLSNKEQIQARALVDRNERLQILSKQKNCTD